MPPSDTSPPQPSPSSSTSSSQQQQQGGSEGGAAAAARKQAALTPGQVVAVGSSIVAAGAVASSVATYRSGAKSLAKDGIDPNVRLRMIPVAFQALMLSTLLTGVLGTAGFYALRAQGFFKTDRAEMPSAKDVAKLIRNPAAFFREAALEEREQAAARPVGSSSQPGPG